MLKLCKIVAIICCLTLMGRVLYIKTVSVSEYIYLGIICIIWILNTNTK